MENPIFRIMRMESMVNNNNNGNNNNMNMNNMNMNFGMQPPPMMNQFQPMGMNLSNNNNIINNNALQEEEKERIELSPDDIYNKTEVENMLELLKCPICLNILMTPVQCNKCNNCFCKLCIDHYQDSKIKCPFRCENPAYLENKFVKNVLSILKFKCKNGCDKIIKYEELEKHYEEDCEKIDYKAKYKGLLKKYKELKKEYDKVKPKININNNMGMGMMNNMSMNNIGMNNMSMMNMNNMGMNNMGMMNMGMNNNNNNGNNNNIMEMTNIFNRIMRQNLNNNSRNDSDSD